MGYKLAISGGQCTGKTTLAKALSNRLDWEVSPEFARIAAAEGYGINKHADARSQTRIIQLQVDWETEREDYNLICDRSPLDALAYALELHRRGRMSAKELEILAAVARMWAQSYTLHIVPSPRDCRMEDDGVRWLDEAVRDRIHDRIITIITALGLPYIEVSGTVEQRTEQVMGELRRRGIETEAD